MDGMVARLSREELFAEVWATPMRKLAERYGMSDVGLAKICKRYEIPRPPVGYWAKKEVGKAPARPPLPPVHEAGLQKVELLVPDGPVIRGPRPFFDPQIAEFAAAEQERPPIRVADALRNPHPLIVRTREWLAKASVKQPAESQYGLREKPEPKLSGLLDLDVSKDLESRSLRILDALLKAFEDRGFDIKAVEDGHKRFMRVRVFGESFDLRLREKLRRVDHKPTPKELAELRLYHGLLGPPKWDFVPSGLLELSSYHAGGHCYPERTWRDSEKRQLESVLGEITPWMLGRVDMAREAAAREQEEARRRAEHERLRREAEARRKREEARRKDLVDQTSAWRMSPDIRE